MTIISVCLYHVVLISCFDYELVRAEDDRQTDNGQIVILDLIQFYLITQSAGILNYNLIYGSCFGLIRSIFQYSGQLIFSKNFKVNHPALIKCNRQLEATHHYTSLAMVNFLFSYISDTPAVIVNVLSCFIFINIGDGCRSYDIILLMVSRQIYGFHFRMQTHPGSSDNIFTHLLI